MNRSLYCSLLVLLLLLAPRLHAQDTLKLFAELPFGSLAAWGSLRPGQLLLADLDANLYLIDHQGQRLSAQSLPSRVVLSEVHSRGGVQTLLFSVDAQQLFFIDRFLRLTRQLQIPFAFGNITALAWAPDGSLRLWDSQARRLLAWDMSSTAPQQLYYMQENLPPVRQMHFVQNYLLLTDGKTYILFFDLLGNYIDKIYFHEPVEIGFWQEGYWLYENHRLRGVRLPSRLQAFDVYFEQTSRILKILCLFPSFLSWDGTKLFFWLFQN
ncbi:hypothetical protein FHS56_000319 [Thermonema lapsum]|uniref:WD40 repeat domain-containing protein n=1 Tax=Thermonema lapsum TaxID=28195 RepID=A0A846MMQ8_9BACT|nr:hypothetical protein [Thermonema lapsum]NIK72833.1 hypothetical protein [Thermonema lapsum]